MNKSETRVAIVTAAGRGIGAACARELAGAGYRVSLLSPSGAAEELARELGGIGFTGSVTEPTDLERLIGGTVQRFGRIDALINNTGRPPSGELLEIPDDDWLRGLDLVLLSVVRMSRLITPVMLEQGKGSIVNISSFVAFEPDSMFPVSAPMRAALGSFAKLYADRYAPSGIRMNNLLPGFTDSYPTRPELEALIPMRRYATVQEIAATARFLLSDDAGYITGQNIRVDGGLTRSV